MDGTVSISLPKRMSKFASVQERLQAHSIPVTESGCIIWIGCCDAKGYGRMSINYKKYGAHRASYELAKGPIPIDRQIDHLCRVRCCINPDHLEAVTVQENISRGQGIAVQRKRQTHCIYGHPLSGDNLLIQKGRYRGCRLCMSRWSLEHSRKKHLETRKKCPKCGGWMRSKSMTCTHCKGNGRLVR